MLTADAVRRCGHRAARGDALVLELRLDAAPAGREACAKAVAIVKQRRPELMVDGEMQADTAVVARDPRARRIRSATLKGAANVLIFPDLDAGNIAYKLLARVGGAEAIGPILLGMRSRCTCCSAALDVDEIMNMAAIAVIDAQEREREAEHG